MINNTIKELSEGLDRMNLIALAVDKMSAMVWIKDLEGRYVYVNNRLAEKKYNTLPNKLVGKKECDLKSNKTKQHIEACNKTDKIVIQKEKSFAFIETDKKGEVSKGHYIIKTPVKGKEGNYIGLVGIALNGFKKGELEYMIKKSSRIEEIIDGYYMLGEVK